MGAEDFYISLPYDISGSRSKNRFRVELLWGINKLLDIYDEPDFTVVFDYVCDVELHIDSRFEFYQVKTHKGTKSYSIEALTSTNNGKHSILGKLYMLRPPNSPSKCVKLAVVSNAYLKCKNTVYSDSDMQPLLDLDDQFIIKIQNALKKEFDISECDISDIYYIHTPINLSDPANDLRGRLIAAFEQIKGCEPKKPNALWRLVYDTVEEKACCEVIPSGYAELVISKGITKKEFSKMLDRHKETASDGIPQTEAYISSLSSYKDRRLFNLALSNIVRDLPRSKELQKFEETVSQHLLDSVDELPQDFASTVDFLLKKFQHILSVEYSSHERYIFCVLILKKFEEGIYQ